MYGYIMNTILEYAKGGIEESGEVTPIHRPEISTYHSVVDGLRNMPGARQKIDVEASDGVMQSIEVVGIPVSGQRSLSLLRIMSDAQAPGYLHYGGQTMHGMLSPNYDHEGTHQKSTVRFQALVGGFAIKNGLWIPDPANAMYLAGATGLESAGVGGHDRSLSEDPEHKLTVLGAVSKEDISIAKTHAQHGIREASDSVAHSLSDGKLGNVFAPQSIDGFEGFGRPIELNGAEQPAATFFIPMGYLERPEQAFGAFITDDGITPEQIVSSAAYRAVKSRGSDIEYYTQAMEG